MLYNEVMSETVKLVEQVSPNLSSEAIKKLDQPAVAVQFVKKGTDGSLEAANTQEAFVVEFGDNIGDAKTDVAAAAGAAPTAAEYKTLVDAYNALANQFNRLIGGMEKCGVLQRPNSSNS